MSTPRFGFLDMLQAQAAAYQAGHEDGKAASGAQELRAILTEAEAVLANCCLVSLPVGIDEWPGIPEMEVRALRRLHEKLINAAKPAADVAKGGA